MRHLPLLLDNILHTTHDISDIATSHGVVTLHGKIKELGANLYRENKVLGATYVELKIFLQLYLFMACLNGRISLSDSML